MHLMTIEMGTWCGASGPGNGRASSQWRDVTCPACLAKGNEHLRVLVWDLLRVMPPGREALAFALRAGRLGVRDEQGRPLAMACDDDPWAASPHPDGCRCQFCREDIRAARAQDDEDAEFLADAASLDDLEPFRDDGHPAPEVPGLFRKGESE
jgi:hypothetical protein